MLIVRNPAMEIDIEERAEVKIERKANDADLGLEQ